MIARVALAASAIALAIACRLLCVKFADPLRDDVVEHLAERDVLMLDRHGTALDYKHPSPEVSSIVVSRPPAAMARAEATWLQAFPPAGAIWPPMTATGQTVPRYYNDAATLVYLGRIVNAAGIERIISLRLTAMLAENHTPQFSLNVRERVGWFGRDPRPLTRWSAGQFMGYADPLHVDPPTLDAADPRRLLVSGTRDGHRFEFEMLLDSADRPQWFDLLQPRASANPTTQDSMRLQPGY